LKETKYNYLSQQIPSALLASLQSAKGFDEEAFVDIHQAAKPLVSIRVNPAKYKPGLLEADPAFVFEEKVPWSYYGYYLKQRPSFTLDPLFHAGVYYVQEASSMFLQEAIRQSCDLSQSLRVLDLCAAPGGKSTLIQSMISNESLLVSNEVIKARVNILAENIIKWGAANVVVTNNDPRDFQRLPDFFDVLVVDAPCSGSGLFRKDPGAIDEWSLNNVMLCRERQQRILSDVMDTLRPGGVLIYSTCSYSLEEDEDICDWLLENHPLETFPLKIPEGTGIVETISGKSKAYGYRFYPDKVKGEGFFIGVFKKTGQSFQQKEIKSKLKPVTLSKTEEETARGYIQNPGIYSFIKWNDEVLAIPLSIYAAFLQLQATLYIKKAGVKLGAIIRNELLPDHELALAVNSSGKIPGVEVVESSALDFLRRKDININADARGWATITYKNIALGLVKILPNRINNYYPREWRILNK
jgi:16S rRNA C967 or C1407 C5-methylase (RsmB/RsmF family)/NOL1/NOP2/fmu family ribosome biogenesis protein